MAITFTWSAAAQVLPSVETPAQALIRQQERERLLREQQQAGRDARLEEAASEQAGRIPDEGSCRRIDRIALDGDDAAVFAWALPAADHEDDRATGRCLGTLGVQEVVRRVQNAIIARGYATTRVGVQAQDLSAGVLTLTVVPGRVGQVRFADGSGGTALWNAFAVRRGDLLNIRALEQGLENLKRLPSVSVRIRILAATGPDARPGESDVEVAWTQSRRARLSVSVDDAGLTATGKLQATATLALDNLAWQNDLFYVSYAQDVFSPADRATRNGTLHYSLPTGNWLWGLTLGRYDYHQPVSDEVQQYRYAGEGRTAELRATRLLHRNGNSRTNAYVRLWDRDSENFLDDTEILVQRRRMGGWEFGLNHRRFFSDNVLDATLSWRRGTGAFGAQRVLGEELGLGSSRPELITANVQLGVPFRIGKQLLRYSGYFYGQWNRTPLVIQDRLAIGGRYSVRGFDGDVSLIGDRGWFLRNDVALALGSGQEFYVGADYGHIGAQGSDATVRGKSLAGAALGLRGRAGAWNWDAFVGVPIEKPRDFPADPVTTGFSLGWNY